MIRCPRCGADAQWGASQCPRCFAPFVAPPTATPPPNWPPQANTQPPGVPRPTGAWPPNAQAPGRPPGTPAVMAPIRPRRWPWVLLAAVLLLAGVGFGLSRRAGASPGLLPRASHSLVMSAPQPPAPTLQHAEPPSSQGIFQVRQQPEQPPVVAIGNTTTADLRLVLEDMNGLTRTEWIPSGGSKELSVPQGYYTATVDAPGGYGILPTSGTLDVKEFHHYQADFILISSDISPPPFHIGD